MKYEINALAGQTNIERIVLTHNGDTAVSIFAKEHATARIVLESEASCAGTLEINTHCAPGARIFVGMCARVTGTDALHIKSFQHHEQPHGTSRVWVRKIVSDDAVATYQGSIHVAKEATGTVVSQDDKTLFDGSRARAESTPVLEVLTDEVSCSHGSALGMVDPQMVWYMETRGLSAREARETLYEAFFDELCQKVLQEGS